MAREKDPTVKEHCYFHINNGGITIEIRTLRDNQGPEIVVSAEHFNTKTSQMSWVTNPESLREVGLAFLRASNETYNPYEYDWMVLSCQRDFGNHQVSPGENEKNVEVLHQFLSDLEQKESENIRLLEKELERAKSRLQKITDPTKSDERRNMIFNLLTEDFGMWHSGIPLSKFSWVQEIMDLGLSKDTRPVRSSDPVDKNRLLFRSKT